MTLRRHYRHILEEQKGQVAQFKVFRVSMRQARRRDQVRRSWDQLDDKVALEWAVKVLEVQLEQCQAMVMRNRRIMEGLLVVQAVGSAV